ncbi:MAG: aldehyde dehydrogenase family protein [Thermoanaerobaculum sp.]|nr:aldehyde dehydrogenase family protein [Thermoanaerobaculum sp.]
MVEPRQILESLGLSEVNPGAYAAGWLSGKGEELVSVNPTTGRPIARVQQADSVTYERVSQVAYEAFLKLRMMPAPKRGEIIRALGDELRAHKEALGRLVSLEMGKILSEGLGEVQEMIDMCDFAVGLSRQLYGLTMASERPHHRMFEQWHPLGPVGIITAFNFPVAVWSWNAAIAVVCGDPVIWKPSSKVPLCALAVQQICHRVSQKFGVEGIFNLVIGTGRDVGQKLVDDPKVPLISFTGSTAQGRKIATSVAGRFGRTILELGGNNAVIVLEDADLDLALRAILFAAVGTAGQRCTTLRRLILQRPVVDRLLDRLIKAYASLRIGDPLDPATHMGPLVDEAAVADMMAALEKVKEEGGEILYGGRRLPRDGFFVEPTIVKAPKDLAIAREETFAPILYVYQVDSLEEAIELNNSVRQGLSSAIFTNNLRAAEKFLSAEGSDCGIANVNIGTSGAEIGGAFGGEKETGGGREAGSDAWKAYMRRQTCTVNYSTELPLAQGVRFEVE